MDRCLPSKQWWNSIKLVAEGYVLSDSIEAQMVKEKIVAVIQAIDELLAVL